ncbi:hypothetical protein BDW72DRAFT_199346 [Aspergillus terricola var. indicus]
MPKLKETAGKIYIGGTYKRLRLELRSLEITPSIWVNGQLNETRFDSLQWVDNDMVIGNFATRRSEWSSTARDTKPYEGLAFAFPKLGSGWLHQNLGISQLVRPLRFLFDIGVPNLVSAGLPKSPGDSELSTDSGASFHLTQVIERFDLNLTSLKPVQKQLYIWGKMQALGTANASIHIDASTPLDIDLPLESANSIDLLGRITSVTSPASPQTQI